MRFSLPLVSMTCISKRGVAGRPFHDFMVAAIFAAVCMSGLSSYPSACAASHGLGGMGTAHGGLARHMAGSQLLRRPEGHRVGLSRDLGGDPTFLASARPAGSKPAWIATRTRKTKGEVDMTQEFMGLRPWPQGGKKRYFIQRVLHLGDTGKAVGGGRGKDEKRKAAAGDAGRKIFAGFVSGVSQAGIFHPWDRALYLAQTNQRNFFNSANWKSPFQGILQTLVLRVTSATVFFPLEDMLVPATQAWLGTGTLSRFFAGNVAGAINAFALNPAQTVRYRCFTILSEGGPDQSFWKVGKDMMIKGGSGAFFKGINPTVMRDLTFGGVFTAARLELAGRFGVKKGSEATSSDQSALFMCDMVAALLATTLSSPFNYARNLIYAHPEGLIPRTTRDILGELVAVAGKQPTPAMAAGYIQRELKIGVANMRVAVAMAMSSTLYRMYYESCQKAATSKSNASNVG